MLSNTFNMRNLRILENQKYGQAKKQITESKSKLKHPTLKRKFKKRFGVAPIKEYENHNT